MPMMSKMAPLLPLGGEEGASGVGKRMRVGVGCLDAGVACAEGVGGGGKGLRLSRRGYTEALHHQHRDNRV